MNNNLYTAFKQAFAENHNKVLIKADSIAYTYADAESESAKIANYLLSLGLQKGDRVTVQVNKSPQALWLYFACLRSGMVFHPLNTAYTQSELVYFIENAEPSLIVCDDVAIFQNITGLSQLVDMDGLLREAKSCSDSFDNIISQPNDLASLLYSSGTTGKPKGIMLSHTNLLENAKTLVKAWGFNEQDVLLHALPIFHVHGLFVAIGCVMLSGASMHWLEKFEATQCIEYLPECTVMMGVPTYYTRLLDQPEFGKEQCKNMRLFISGSAPLLEETFHKFQQRSGHAILERYGMTETNMNTSNPLKGERKPSTVGLPLPGVEARVVGVDNKLLPTGEVGDLQIRGKNVFQGYWHMPEKTSEDFTEDGFFNTGDKGVVDEDGYFSIVGRSKDMIITGGLNVYPKEIEQFIDQIDGVKESAVIGIPHKDFGEAVVAVIVEQQPGSFTESELHMQLKGEIANFKLPKQIFFVAELPRNAMGKVQKNLLRKEYS